MTPAYEIRIKLLDKDLELRPILGYPNHARELFKQRQNRIETIGSIVLKAI